MSGKRVGANMQTIPGPWQVEGTEGEEHPLSIGMRDLFIADEGCYIGKVDLKGADGGTIGALLASLGEPTMQEDIAAGLKPQQPVALEVTQLGCTRGKSREQLKEMAKSLGGWQYFASKCLIWGYSYGLGPDKGAELVFVESEGKVNLNRKQINTIFSVIENRYHSQKLKDWMARHMSSQSYPAKLVAPNGFTRKFFERNWGQKPECLRSALAHLPQVVTTHVIEMAMHSLYNDPDNRRVDGSLRVEVLHSVHDELVMQWRIEDTDFTKAKVPVWFHVPLLVAGQKVLLGYDGSYSYNWAQEPKVGTL
jgi:cation transport regulator ChaB